MGPTAATIVVPVHNGERYLEQALESIATQNLDSWEAVIVDDASSDGSLAQAQAFAQRHPDRVTVLALEHNLGVAGARNAGLQVARRGRLVVLLDQDDYLLDTFLERTVALYDAALAAGRRPGIVTPDGLVETAPGVQQRYSDRFWWRDEVDLDSLLARNYVIARCAFSRAAFDEVGGFDPRCLTGDDYDLWLRLVEAGYEVVRTREPLFVWRIHDAAQSQDKLAVARAALAVYARVLERGAINRRQRRIVARRMRHYRAVRDRAIVAGALRSHHYRGAARVALAGGPTALLAMLENGRWWVRQRDRLTRAHSAA